MRRFTTALVTILAVFALLPYQAAYALEIGGPRDCDNNAIIRCGAHSTIELKQAYRASTYAQKVYSHFGISPSDMQKIGSTSVVGKVTQRGNVYIEGQSKPVATNAMTAGRQDIPGSAPVTTDGITYYKRAPSVSFQQPSLPAFVMMKNGEFQFAVIASCANPVSATPVIKRASTAPIPEASVPVAPAAPTQTQSQSQSQQVIVQTVASEKPQPQKQSQPLPNVGPAGTAAVFALSTIGGALLYRRRLLGN